MHSPPAIRTSPIVCQQPRPHDRLPTALNKPPSTLRPSYLGVVFIVDFIKWVLCVADLFHKFTQLGLAVTRHLGQYLGQGGNQGNVRFKLKRGGARGHVGGGGKLAMAQRILAQFSAPFLGASFVPCTASFKSTAALAMGTWYMTNKTSTEQLTSTLSSAAEYNFAVSWFTWLGCNHQFQIEGTEAFNEERRNK